MALNKKTERVKSLEKNILKSSEAIAHKCSTATCFRTSKKFLKKRRNSWEFSTSQNIDPITLFLCSNFLNISKKLLLKAINGNFELDGNGNYERKIIMRFMILTTRDESNPKATVWNSSENLMSVKVVAKLK